MEEAEEQLVEDVAAAEEVDEPEDEPEVVREVQEEVEAMMARNRWVFRPSTIQKRKVIVIYIYFFTI